MTWENLGETNGKLYRSWGWPRKLMLLALLCNNISVWVIGYTLHSLCKHYFYVSVFLKIVNRPSSGYFNFRRIYINIRLTFEADYENQQSIIQYAGEFNEDDCLFFIIKCIGDS